MVNFHSAGTVRASSVLVVTEEGEGVDMRKTFV
jgi:hypothetical protein